MNVRQFRSRGLGLTVLALLALPGCSPRGGGSDDDDSATEHNDGPAILTVVNESDSAYAEIWTWNGNDETPDLLCPTGLPLDGSCARDVDAPAAYLLYAFEEAGGFGNEDNRYRLGDVVEFTEEGQHMSASVRTDGWFGVGGD